MGPNVNEKLPYDQEFLSIFTKISRGNKNERNTHCSKLIKYIQQRQKKSNGNSRELKYSVQRLVRGLSSSHIPAREGFSYALTQLLLECPEISNKDVLENAAQHLELSNTDTKAEKTGKLLGQVLVYTALLQANRIEKISSEDIKVMSQSVTTTLQKKPVLHVACVEMLCQLIKKVSTEVFCESVWPFLQENVKQGWDKGTADDLLLVLTARQFHKDAVSKNLKSTWGKKILKEDRLTNVADILARSGCEGSEIHPLCAVLVKQVTQAKISKFWEVVIVDRLLRQDQKKHLAIRLIEEGVKNITSAEQVEQVLNDNIIKYILKLLINVRHNLNAAAKTMVKSVVTLAGDHTENPDLQLALLSRLCQQPGSVNFDLLTQTKTVAGIVSHLNQSAAKQFAKDLMSALRGENTSLCSTLDDVSLVKNCVSHLCGTLTCVPFEVTEEWHAKILQFFLLYGFFNHEQSSKAVPHCKKPPQTPVLPTTQECLQEGLFRSLNRLASFCSVGKGKKDHLPYINLLESIINYTQKLFSHSDVATPIKPFTKEVKKLWKTSCAIMKKLNSKEEDRAEKNKRDAFLLLLQQLTLHLLVSPSDCTDTLQELHSCFEKAFQDSDSESSSEDEEEFSWVEVMVELLLSLLAQSNHRLRITAIGVFRLLSSSLTPDALQLVLQMLEPGWAEGPLAFEDAEEGGDENEGELSGGQEDSDDADDKSDDEDEDEDETVDKDEADTSEDEDDEEDSDVEEEEMEDDTTVDVLRSKVKEVLGDAAGASDEESEMSDMDDDQMIKMDGLLAAAFRGKANSGKKNMERKREQMKQYKLKCLDFVDVTIQNEPTVECVLALMEHLPILLAWCRRQKKLEGLGHRVSHSIKQICTLKKVEGKSLCAAKNLPQRVETIFKESTKAAAKPILSELRNSCIFLVTLMQMRQSLLEQDKSRTADADSDFTEMRKILENFINTFSEQRTLTFNWDFLVLLFERYPIKFWSLTDDILSHATNENASVFKKTQFLSILSKMLIKRNVGKIEHSRWKPFVKSTAGKVCKIIETQVGSEQLKSRLATEAVSVLHKCLVVGGWPLLQDEIPSEMADHLQKLKASGGSTDLRRACNCVSGYIFKGLKFNKQQKRKQPGTSKDGSQKHKIAGQNLHSNMSTGNKKLKVENKQTSVDKTTNISQKQEVKNRKRKNSETLNNMDNKKENTSRAVNKKKKLNVSPTETDVQKPSDKETVYHNINGDMSAKSKHKKSKKKKMSHTK